MKNTIKNPVLLLLIGCMATCLSVSAQISYQDSIKVLKKDQQINDVKLELQKHQLKLADLEKNMLDYAQKAQKLKIEALKETAQSYHSVTNATTNLQNKDAEQAEKQAKRAFKKNKQSAKATEKLNDAIQDAEKLKKNIQKLQEKLQELQNK